MPFRSFPWSERALVAAGLAVAVYPLGLLLGFGGTIPRHVALFYAAVACYLVALWLLRSTDDSPRLLGIIVTVALGLRLLALASHPALSDDLYRYIWDGKVILHGINPYRYPPGAEQLAWLRDALWRPINAKGQITPYPPGAEGIFALTYSLAGASVRAQQIVATVGDLGVIGMLWLLLRQRGLPRRLLLVYAWCPLPLMEYAHSAHNDAWMAALLLAALWLTGRGERERAALALALSVLVKLFAVAALPALAARWRLRHLVIVLVVVGAGFVPFFAGANPLQDVVFEAGSSRFNDSLALLLAAFAGRLGVPVVAPVASSLALLTMATVVFAHVRHGGDVLCGSFGLVVGLLLLSPVVEPWYALWALPFVPLLLTRPGPARVLALGWLSFSCLVPLTELTYALGPRLWPAVRLAEYLPVYGALAVALVAVVRRGTATRRVSVESR